MTLRWLTPLWSLVLASCMATEWDTWTEGWARLLQTDAFSPAAAEAPGSPQLARAEGD